MKDYYNILGISPFSTQDEIKERYQYLAQAYHPDKFLSSKHKFVADDDLKLINEAYQTLSNSTRKNIYDKEYWHYRENIDKPDNKPVQGNGISKIVVAKKLTFLSGLR